MSGAIGMLFAVGGVVRAVVGFFQPKDTAPALDLAIPLVQSGTAQEMVPIPQNTPLAPAPAPAVKKGPPAPPPVPIAKKAPTPDDFEL